MNILPVDRVLSIFAPVIAWPDICAMIGVTETCISRSLMLSAETLTAWIKAAEVLAALLVSPPYCAVME
jgi:hypothetical protein